MFIDRISDRHELRLLQIADAAELFALTNVNRYYLRQWLPWLDVVTQIGDTRDFIVRTLKQFANNESFVTAICYDGCIVGTIGFVRIEQCDSPPERLRQRMGYIGYWLAESHCNKGIMTKSCDRLIHYGFTTLKLDRIAIACATENHRSRAIPLRLGFTHEGVNRDATWLYVGGAYRR
jgi:ribosomal-protein-serine acetyltransferase